MGVSIGRPVVTTSDNSSSAHDKGLDSEWRALLTACVSRRLLTESWTTWCQKPRLASAARGVGRRCDCRPVTG
jgi:hypothetical protein